MEKSAKSNGVIEMEISKTGMTLEDAVKLFPEFMRRRGKYKAAAQSILNQTKDLNPQQIHPCEVRGTDAQKSLGLVLFTNDYLKENNSNWRLKYSPSANKYALYNLELLGKKK